MQTFLTTVFAKWIKAELLEPSLYIKKKSFPLSEKKKKLIIPFSEILKISNQSSSC